MRRFDRAVAPSLSGGIGEALRGAYPVESRRADFEDLLVQLDAFQSPLR